MAEKKIVYTLEFKSNSKEVVGKVNKEIKNLDSSYSKLIKVNKKYSDELEREKIKQQTLSTAKKKVIRDNIKYAMNMKELAILEKKENLSLEQQARITSLLIQKRKKMIVTTKQERTAFNNLTLKIEKYNRSLLKSDKNIGRFQRNVGNYASGLKSLIAGAGIAGLAMQAISFLKTSTKLYEQQAIAVQKLTTILHTRTNATESEVQSVLDLTSAQQKLGVIGDEVQIAGTQQLGTFIHQTESLKTLIPAMNNLTAQQKGLNATQGDATNIANLMGKALQGQLGALTRVGISFDEGQGKILKYGNEQERAAVLAEVINQNVGEMNKSLASTDLGQIKNATNNLGDMQEKIGKSLIPIISAFYKILFALINVIKDNLSPIIDEMKLSFNQIGDSLKSLSKTLGFTGKKALSLKKYFEFLIAPTKIMWKMTSLLISVIAKLIDYFASLINNSKFLKNIFNKIGIAIKEVSEWISIAYDNLIKFLGVNDISNAEKIKKVINDLTEAFNKLNNTDKKKLTEELAQLSKDFKNGKISLQEYGDGLIKLKAKLNALTKTKVKNIIIDDNNKKDLKEKEKNYDYEVDLLKVKIEKEKILLDRYKSELDLLNEKEVSDYLNKLKEKNDDEKEYLNRTFENSKKSAEEISKMSAKELDNYNKKRIVEKKKLDNELLKLDISYGKKIMDISLQVSDDETKHKLNNILQYTDEKIKKIQESAESEKNIINETAKYQKNAETEKNKTLQKQLLLKYENNKLLMSNYLTSVEELNAQHQKNLEDIEKNRINKIVNLNKKAEEQKVKDRENTFKTIGMLMNTLDKIDEAKMNAEIRRAGNNEKEKDRIKLKYAKKEKQRAVATVAIDAAKAIIGTWAGYSEMGPYGAILAGIQTALIVGLATAQISAINSQPVMASGGLLDAPLHSQGGASYGSANIEGKEFVVNRASTAKFYPVLESINSAGNTTGREDDTHNVDIIDYDKLAKTLNNKKVYITTRDINESLEDDNKIKTQNTL